MIVSTAVDRYVEFTKFMETILGVTSHSISEHRQRHLALTVNSPKDSDHLEISSGSSVGYRGGGRSEGLCAVPPAEVQGANPQQLKCQCILHDG